MNKIQRLSLTLMMMLLATATWAYTVTFNNTSGITITAKVDGNAIISTTDVMAGKTVVLTVAENDTKYLTTLQVQSDVPAGGASAPRRTPSITIQGDVEVRQTGEFTYEFTMPIGNVTITPTFADRMDISSGTNAATITLSQDSYTFDWLPHTPSITGVTSGGASLDEGNDYTVNEITPKTATNPYTNATTYTVSISGKGKYKGTATTSYTISQRNLAGQTGDGGYSAASVLLAKSSTTFTHNNQKPVVSGVYMNGQSLVQGTDYYVATDLDAENGFLNAATYPISISGKGNFTGTTSADYIINPMPLSSCTITYSSNFTYNGSVQQPTIFDGTSPRTTDISISDGVASLIANTDYELKEYSNASSTQIGSYTMTVKAVTGTDKNYTGEVILPYNINSAGAQITHVETIKYTDENTYYSTPYTGKEIKPDITVKDGETTLTKGNHYDVVYYNNVNAGWATVSAVGKSPYNFNISRNFKINPKSLTDGMVTLSATSFVYNASVQKPTVTVTDEINTGTTESPNMVSIIKTSDYVITNEGGTNVNPTATPYQVVVQGQNNYTGTINKTFSITALAYDNDNTTITLGTTDYVYDGTAKTPTVQQVKIGGIVIPSTDYTAVPSNNTDAGTATVTISPKTSDPINLSGSATKDFTIAKRPISDMTITLSATSFTYNGSEQKPTVTIEGLTLDTDYTLTWPEASTAVGSYSVTIKGINNYTGEIVKTYVINYGTSDNDFTVVLADATTPIYYDGSAKEPALTVTKTGVAVALVKGTDYDVSYSNNVNVGTATIVVTGMNNYQFLKTTTFNIQPRTFTENAQITVALSGTTSFTYDGTKHQPTITVTDAARVTSEQTLLEGTDYTISEAQTDVGTYSVTVTGTGNYTGTKASTATYAINMLDITGATVTLSSTNYLYDGTDKKPTVLQLKKGTVVIPSTDYDVSWENCKNAGKKGVTTTYPKVVISPHNFGTATASKYNLSGSVEQDYVIDQKSIALNEITITVAPTELTYTGGPLKPTTITVEDTSMPTASRLLSENTDYTLGYPIDITSYGVKNFTINGIGNYTGSVTKSYTIIGNTNFVVKFNTSDGNAPTDIVYDGTAHEPAVVVTTDGDPTNALAASDYDVSYSSNKDAGTAYVTVTGKNNYSGSISLPFNIGKRLLTTMSGTDPVITATLTPSSFYYNGNPQQPTTITVFDAGANINKNLTLSKDYTVTYPSDVTNQGTKTVTITGTGNYSGTLSPTYTINQLDISTATVTLFSLSSYVYDGANKEPGVQLVKVGDVVVPSSAYSVVYSNNMNASTATTKARAIVTAKTGSNFTGSAYAEFSIEQKEVTSSMITLSGEGFNTVSNSFTYDGASHSPTVTVANGTLAMALTTDYTLTNPTHTEVGNYVVQIDGTGNYKGTATKQYSIVTAGSTAFTVEAIPAQTYTGLALMPEPVVKATVNNVLTTLTKGTHYTVAWANNVNVGTNTASVIVTGLDNYAGTQTVYFTINPKELIADETTLSATAFSYNGTEQKPTVTVTDGGTTLVKDKDYTLAYPDDIINQGTKTITITGIGNYASQFTKTYAINQLSLSTATITLATLTSYVYDGTAKTPAVQLVKVGELVVPTTAYDVVYTSNTNVGTATVTVTAKMGTNFKDGNTTTFSIEQKPVTSDMIYLSSENLEYTGSNIKPEVTVKDGTKTLALTTDYTLTNAGGTEVGSYEVMITGQGNYKGTAKKQYSIITKGAAGFTVDELTVPLTYTGMPLTPTVTVKKAGTTTVLTLGTDYEVAYTDNINVGTATATVTGKGNYSGTRSVNFTINPKPLTDGMVALSSTSFIYSGSEQKPVVSVTDTDNNMPLTQNTDYTVTYPADAISQGTKTVTIRGIGNYTGEITKDYTIGLLSLNDASVTLNELTSYIYDGNEKKPTVKEVKVGTLVIPTTGYTVAYPDDVINIGTKTMTITGKGNYTGATTASYTITPKTVNKEMILLSNENLIYTGSIIKPTVTVKDGSKTLIENTDYTLTNEGGKEVGTYSLTITGKGNYTGTASRTFNIITKGASVFSVSDIASVIYNGSEQEPDITVMDNSTTPATVLTKGTHYTVAYSNNKNVGSASVIVTGIGSYAGTVSKNFTILPKTLTGAMVTLSATSFVFNSLAQKPEVTVDDKNAANVSIITDYDYTILNNGGINVGDNHEVKVTGKGNYTGTVTKTYAITPLSIANANVTLYQLQSYVYDGTAKKPGVREVMVDDITVPTTGYDVSYGENTNVGNATVTVTGKGNFKDTKTVNFTITGKPITSDMIVLSSENFIYNGEVQKPTVVVKDGAKTLTLGTDYALTNAGGTSVGTYSVTVAGMGNYASEASRSYSIVEKDGTTNFTISLSNTSVQYNGSAQTPAVTVTDGVKTLTNNTDYEVAYTNHVNVGTATVTVTGKGNYAGTKMATFTITAKPLTEAMVTLSETSFVYNTLIQKPEVSVSDGDIMTKDDYVITNNGGTNQGTYHVIVNGQGNYSGQIDKTFTITPLSIAEANVTLYQLQSYVYEGLQKKPGVREVTVGNINVPTQGYTTSYGDNVNAGTASVTVTGQGNFKDSKTVTFEIEPKAVENSMITLSNYEYTYNGEIQKPEVIVRDGETTLVLDTDYTLLNNGGKTVGAYDVTITGKGNYKGTASKTYIINAKEVGSFEVTLSAESVIYNGSEQQPEVTVKDGETVLTPGVNYTVAYRDNVNVGMATVTVRGLGEYDGSRNKTFLIKPKELSNAMVSLSNTTFTYNGLLQMPAVTVSDGTALTSNDYYITNEGGLDKGTYNVMVTGRNNYTGTVVRQYAINPMSINDAHVTLYQLQSYVYDGTEKNPGVREVAVGSHIVPSTSFTTTISPNINVGTVTVTVTGEKNYTGLASTTFEITPKPVTSGMITLTPDYFYYNGSVQKPAVSVKDGSKNMVENTDYTVTNEGGMEAGDYEVKVKGIGNYMDEASVKFTILSSGVNTFVVTLETTEYTFDGTEHKPNVTVKMEDRTLSEGTDYTLIYNNNVNAGTATVTVKGVGDYTGEQMKTFVILPKTLTGEMVTLDKTSFIYNEKVQKPEVTVADGTLMTEDDYTVTNDGGTEEGTYQVVVVGQNNYKGTVIKSFTITREEIHGDDDPEHPDEKTVTYTPTEEGSDEVKVSGCEGTETELEQVTSVTVPATFTSNGKTYTVVGISANAFANVPNLTDVYLPDTEEPLEIAEDAIPATATIHTTLALLDNYALMPSLSESFKAGKIMTTVTAKNRYWTFSSGVDVYVPDGVSVYIARERDNATVTIVELSDNDLTVGGQRIIKHNNGVLISSEGNDTPYDLVACGRRMTSGTTISTDDYKDYGSQNCLVPVIVATHFGTGYYFMKNNEFYSIQEESEDIKVPAGKAVLYLRQAASSPSYSSIIQLVNTGEVTNINSITDDTDEGDWYDMSGRKLNGRPTKKGVYIKNNKKTVIR
jgi:hypothetical protein